MGLRVFRTLSERLLCRCNLLAQDCARLLHVTSFARIAILDLVLGIILSNEQHLVTFPIAVIVHLLRNCEVITGFFCAGIFLERIEWCEEDSLSSFLAFLSTWNESVLKDRLDAGRTTPVKNILFPICKESECAPSTQAQLLFHESVLELLGSKPRNFCNPHSSRTSPCCFTN